MSSFVGYVFDNGPGVALAGLELPLQLRMGSVLLPRLPKCWNHKCVLPSLALLASIASVAVAQGCQGQTLGAGVALSSSHVSQDEQ